MKKYLFIFVCLILITGCSFFKKNPNSNSNSNSNKNITGNNPTYFSAGSIDYDDNTYENVLVTDYSKYKEIVNHFATITDIKEEDFNTYEFLAIGVKTSGCHENFKKIIDAQIKGKTVNITFTYELQCGLCAPEKALFFVRFNKGEIPEGYSVNVTGEAINTVDCPEGVDYKPVIYLYPTKTTDVSVKFAKPELLTTTYPKYENAWTVTATKDGNLYDQKTNRNYYALYYESLTSISKGVRQEGFVVENKNTIKFLEDKLSKLGLTERESNEFIMYWLPKLEQSKYNYIYFNTLEEVNADMPIEVNPKPDTMIRIIMEYKPLSEPINVKEQVIITPERKGFTLVEWGGTKIN